MILIYYKDAAGHICDYMIPPEGWTIGQVKQEIDGFNALHGGRTKAYAELIRDGHYAELERTDCLLKHIWERWGLRHGT